MPMSQNLNKKKVEKAEYFRIPINFRLALINQLINYWQRPDLRVLIFLCTFEACVNFPRLFQSRIFYKVVDGNEESGKEMAQLTGESNEW